MRLLLLLLSVTAVLTLQCPHPCEDCSTTDELEFKCKLTQGNVSFNARINEYVNIRCAGTNFNCSDLPTINLANNWTLPSLGVINCSPSILRCVKDVLQLSSVTSVLMINNTEPLDEQDVMHLGNVESFMIQSGADSTIPTSAFKLIATLRNVRLSRNNLTLHSGDFSSFPPLYYLELSSDKISELPTGTFDGLSELKILNIWGNRFSNVSVNSLRGLDSLERLTLNVNNLSLIEEGAFAHTPKLKTISLAENKLQVLPAGLLYNLPQLENITIQSNEVPLILESQSLSNLTSLKNLILEGAKITTLPEDLLTGNTGLQTLSLYYNKITSLPAKLFDDLASLETLNLSFNKIKGLPAGVFLGLKQLKILNLNRNHLEALPELLFSGLLNLQQVTIDHNYLTTISPRTFLGANNLEHLSLVANKLTLKPEDDVFTKYFNLEQAEVMNSPFDMLRKLKRLLLSGNEIDVMFSDWRLILVNLEKLDLSRNQFSYIDMNDVQFLSKDVTVDLRHNNITSVRLLLASPSNNESPDDQPTQNTILLDNNPLECDCGIYPLAMRLRGAKPLTTEPNLILGNARCASPPNLQGEVFKYVSPNDLNCDLPQEYCDTCPSCRMRPAFGDLDYDCITMPPILPVPQEFGANSISLQLKTVPRDISNLSVRLLNLSGLGIKEIHFNPSDTVEIIDLSYNNLSRVPMKFLRSKTYLYLANNPIECQCWYSDEISELQKSLFVKDLTNMTCQNGDKLAQVDVTALCSSWKAAMVASGTFMTLVLLVAICVIAIYRYSREIIIFIIKYNLFPCFFVEDLTDANKEYDLFISYAHKDFKYIKELLPKVEKDFGQKICIHYRDWLVGDMIPTQIERSVGNSRRTLILFSNNFLDSPYARNEFTAAYNLSRKEGRTRIILILLEDDVINNPKLSEEMKAYFKTNTYLAWNDSRFWQKLERACPRKDTKRFVWPTFKHLCGGTVINDECDGDYIDKVVIGDKSDCKGKTVINGLDVHVNSAGQLVNMAGKDV